MKYKLFPLFLLSILISCGGDSVGGIDDEIIDDTLSDVIYAPSNDVFSNPERGFMHTWSVASEGTPLNTVTLESLKNENVTIILRLYYLEAFKDSNLSETQLNLIKTDFTRLREAGIKCVLRFAYTDTADGTDAPLNIIQTHLDQLKPIFTENADVIAFVQAGFIGSWGEWYYSSNGLANTVDRKAVIDKLLEVLPDEIKIQVRAPLYKQEIFEYTTPIDVSVGYGTTDLARVGFHNDCFLASVDDYGTYQNIALEKDYISDEALFVPTGGETCPPSGIPNASCETARNEMALLKWTYLNLDWYQPVLDVWRNNGCFADFQRQLGYRLLLKSSSLKNEATVDGNFELNTIINNIGYAPVYNTKNTFLVFRSLTDGTLYKKALDFDVRKVIPIVDYELKESVSLSGIPAGQYELLLKIEDSHETLSDRSEYSIRLANTDIWEAVEGLNNLSHTITIN